MEVNSWENLIILQAWKDLYVRKVLIKVCESWEFWKLLLQIKNILKSTTHDFQEFQDFQELSSLDYV